MIDYHFSMTILNDQVSMTVFQWLFFMIHYHLKVIFIFILLFFFKMSSEQECAAAVCSNYFEQGKKQSRKNRKLWVNPWLSRRNERGIYNNLIQELQNKDINEYRRFLKMTRGVFNESLQFYENLFLPKCNLLQLFIIFLLEWVTHIYSIYFVFIEQL